MDIVFRDTGQLERTTIDSVTLDETGGATNLRVSFARLVPLEEILEREQLSPTTFRIVIDRQTSAAPLAAVVEDLWWLLQALETSRAICQEVLSTLDADRRFVLPSTRLRRLSLTSPLEALLEGNVPQIILVYFAIRGLIRLKGDYWSAQLTKEEALGKRANNRARGIRPRLNTERLIDAITRLIHDLLVSAHADLSKRGLDTERVRSLVEKHLQRSLEGITEEETGIEIDLTKDAAEVADAIEADLDNGGGQGTSAPHSDNRDQ